MPVGLCRYCLNTKPLIEAHIIPKGFFKRIEGNGPNYILDEDNHPRKSRKGYYDTRILCAGCDNKIGLWDDYAQVILTMDMSGFTRISGPEGIGGWDHYSCDYQKLKLFFISLLWRASISKLAAFKKIDIGPWEDVARAMMMADDPGDAQAFTVILTRFTEVFGHSFFDPHMQDIEGIQYGRFYMAGFQAFIKAGTRPSSFLEEVVLREGDTLRVVKMSIHDTGEGKIMTNILNSPKNANFIKHRRK